MPTKYRELTPEEVAALWLYGEEYAKSKLSATQWWKTLDEGRARVVIEFAEQMEKAFRDTKRIKPMR